jgi:RimJ/RimL family protein N-acetyltransferase
MTDVRVRLRPAAGGDASFLLALRNDPDVRRQSRTQTEITIAEHERWLEGVLRDSNRSLYVIESDGQPVGQLRLDRTAQEAEVSLAVASVARGRGIATAALEAATDSARGSDVHLLRAFVKKDNHASLSAFLRAGYAQQSEEADLVELVRTVGDDG